MSDEPESGSRPMTYEGIREFRETGGRGELTEEEAESDGAPMRSVRSRAEVLDEEDRHANECGHERRSGPDRDGSPSDPSGELP
jgi:hypothetical protein